MRDVMQAVDRQQQGYVPVRKLPMILAAANLKNAIGREHSASTEMRARSASVIDPLSRMRGRSRSVAAALSFRCTSSASSSRGGSSRELGLEVSRSSLESKSSRQTTSRGEAHAPLSILGIFQVQEQLLERLVAPGIPGVPNPRTLFARYAAEASSSEAIEEEP